MYFLIHIFFSNDNLYQLRYPRGKRKPHKYNSNPEWIDEKKARPAKILSSLVKQKLLLLIFFSKIIMNDINEFTWRNSAAFLFSFFMMLVYSLNMYISFYFLLFIHILMRRAILFKITSKIKIILSRILHINDFSLSQAHAHKNTL